MQTVLRASILRHTVHYASSVRVCACERASHMSLFLLFYSASNHRVNPSVSTVFFLSIMCFT